MGTLDLLKVGGVGLFLTLFAGFTQSPHILPMLMVNKYKMKDILNWVNQITFVK
jgi:hypothetical protein